jgi:catechol 2,3-dioxygenase-like lactoylglutathione lyase family enzyme
MPLKLDHVVILVRELEAAMAAYHDLGFNVRPGGAHADGSTHNALVGFADGSYLELIAFLRPAPEHRWGRFASAGWQGLIDFALLPGDLAEVVAAARAGGVAYAGPTAGGRLRPDGVRLEWQTGTPPSLDLPFLCGDLTPRPLRVPEGEVRVHANGVQGVASLTVVVTDLDRSLAHYRALLGPTATAATRVVESPELGLREAALALGATSLVLVQPSPDRRAARDLAGTLAERGEGVAQLALCSTKVLVPVELPLALTQGARIDIVAMPH